MTPNPDSSAYIRNDIPDDVWSKALRLKEVYSSLQANIKACVWPFITSDCLSVEYHTSNGGTSLKILFIDTNGHSHTFIVRLVAQNCIGAGKVWIEYEFEGGIDAPVVSIRSFAEWVMLQLWQYDIDAELCLYDRALSIQSDIDTVYEDLVHLLDIVTNNIKPIDWFLSKEPIWQFYRTYYDLRKMLPLLKEEAAKERWKDVKPENFRLIRNADCALICLDYTERNYTMKFRVGMKKDGFAAERTDKFMDMFYEFENHAPTEEARAYYEKVNLNFSEIANVVLDIPFSWKTLFFHSEDGFYINTYRENAFQKYCLMLDCILPLKNKYEASETFIPQELLDQKKRLEESLGMDLEISEEQEPDHIFTHGRYVEEYVEEDISDDCPF